MQDFTYSLSLHIFHPDIDPGLISQALKLEPTGRTTKKGEPKTTPDGKPRDGCWEFSHWKHCFEVSAEKDFVPFLRRMVETLGPHREFLQRIVSECGEIECFVGIFTDTNCDQILPFDLLGKLADLRIALRLDIYGSKLRQKEHPKQP